MHRFVFIILVCLLNFNPVQADQKSLKEETRPQEILFVDSLYDQYLSIILDKDNPHSEKMINFLDCYKEKVDFSVGFAVGVYEGSTNWFRDLFPYIGKIVQGIKQGFYTCFFQPSKIPSEMVRFSKMIFEYVTNHTVIQSLAIVFPELRDLSGDWNSYSSYRKGKILGYITGNYGTDFFGFCGLLKGFSMYKNLHKANRVFALEKMNKTLSVSKSFELSSGLKNKKLFLYRSETFLVDRSMLIGDVMGYMEEIARAD